MSSSTQLQLGAWCSPGLVALGTQKGRCRPPQVCSPRFFGGSLNDIHLPRVRGITGAGVGRFLPDGRARRLSASAGTLEVAGSLSPSLRANRRHRDGRCVGRTSGQAAARKPWPNHVTMSKKDGISQESHVGMPSLEEVGVPRTTTSAPARWDEPPRGPLTPCPRISGRWAGVAPSKRPVFGRWVSCTQLLGVN